MRRNTVLVSALVMGVTAALVFGAAGCAKKAASASDAIQQAKTMKTPQEQADYLVGQAKLFLSSKEYKEAIQSAQYVLSNVDANSQEAKALIEKAKTQMAGAAQGAVKDLKKSFGQ